MHDKLDSLPADAAATKPWWQRPYRMIQTNLRQPDALVDQKLLARQVREFGANVLLYNIGGIFAFYPTRLPLQAVNPMMKGDALGAAVEAAHAEGLAIVGRYDMSKATRIAYEAHPDWFVHNEKGEPLEYNGTYQACVNGGWYQEYALEIISESLGQYDVDGVFFNMFGYTNFTYSGQYFGICVCDNCRRRFRDMYGKPLPVKEDFSDPSYTDYLAFKDRTSLELRAKVYDHIKKVNPKVAMTGHRGKSDLIRLETQRAVDRPQPEWPYQAGEQAKWGRAYGKGRTVSSTSANFIDFAWRFSAESWACQELRAAQQLANGATLDFYLLGVMDQDDKKAFPQVSALFKWHREHEDHYAGLERAAKVALYQSHKCTTYLGATRTRDLGQAPFRGAYRALSEARIPFDFVGDESIEGPVTGDDLGRYDAIVLPNVTCMSDAEAAVIDAYVESGGTILATGETGFYDEAGRRRDRVALASLPVEGLPYQRNRMRGAYFRVGEGDPALEGVRLVMLDGRYYVPEVRTGATTHFTLLPPQRFGPPELCFPDVESTLPGAIVGRHGKGTAIYLPWHPDWQYYRDSLLDHRAIIAGLVARHTPPAPVVIEGRGQVEINVLCQPATGRLLIHVVNYAGQRNNLYEDPAEVGGLRLGVRGAAGPAQALRAGRELVPAVSADRGYTWYHLPPVGTFEAVSVAVGA